MTGNIANRAGFMDSHHDGQTTRVTKQFEALCHGLCNVSGYLHGRDTTTFKQLFNRLIDRGLLSYKVLMATNGARRV